MRTKSNKALQDKGDARGVKTMILNETFTLSNGVKIPKLGLGTWRIDDSKVAQAVRDAINIGYRHIDTAQGYGNERGVGEGVCSCGVPRDELFVTTKLDAGIKSYNQVVAATQQGQQGGGDSRQRRGRQPVRRGASPDRSRAHRGRSGHAGDRRTPPSTSVLPFVRIRLPPER